MNKLEEIRERIAEKFKAQLKRRPDGYYTVSGYTVLGILEIIDAVIAEECAKPEPGDVVVFSESDTWDAFESGYMQGHNDTVESCVRDSKEAAQDYFADVRRKVEEAGE